MKPKIKRISIYVFLSIANFIINFLIYNVSFNKQATPFIHEEQRVESALMMISTTIPAFLVTSIFFSLAFYFMRNKYN